MPGRMAESTILVSEEGRAIVTDRRGRSRRRRRRSRAPSGCISTIVGRRALPADVGEARLSVDAGNTIDGLDLSRVSLYAPTKRTDDGRRAGLTVVTRGRRGCVAYVD